MGPKDIEKMMMDSKEKSALPTGIDHVDTLVEKYFDLNDQITEAFENQPEVFKENSKIDQRSTKKAFDNLTDKISSLKTERFNLNSNQDRIRFKKSDYLVGLAETLMCYQTGFDEVVIDLKPEDLNEYKSEIKKSERKSKLFNIGISLSFFLFIGAMLSKYGVILPKNFLFFGTTFLPSDFFTLFFILTISKFFSNSTLGKHDNAYAFVLVNALNKLNVVQDIYLDIFKAHTSFEKDMGELSPDNSMRAISIYSSFPNGDKTLVSMDVKDVFYFNENKELTSIFDSKLEKDIPLEKRFVKVDLTSEMKEIEDSLFLESLNTFSENKVQDGYLFELMDDRICLERMIRYNTFYEEFFLRIFMNKNGETNYFLYEMEQ